MYTRMHISNQFLEIVDWKRKEKKITTQTNNNHTNDEIKVSLSLNIAVT